MGETGVCEKVDGYELCFKGNNCSSTNGCECTVNVTTGPCKAGDVVYQMEDFGKKCTTTGCADATDTTPNDTKSIPSLIEGVAPHKCADKNLPVCIKDQINEDECACFTFTH